MNTHINRNNVILKMKSAQIVFCISSHSNPSQKEDNIQHTVCDYPHCRVILMYPTCIGIEFSVVIIFPFLYTCVEESGGECARKTPSLKLLAKLVW